MSIRKVITIGAAVLAITVTTVTALAATRATTPAEILAGLTGKPVETVMTERTETEQTYGALASKYGVLDGFREQMLEEKKELLKQRVAEGTMSQERADAIIEAMELNQANCDGTGNGGSRSGAGCGMGAGFGRMNENSRGFGNGCGGSCQYTG